MSNRYVLREGRLWGAVAERFPLHVYTKYTYLLPGAEKFIPPWEDPEITDPMAISLIREQPKEVRFVDFTIEAESQGRLEPNITSLVAVVHPPSEDSHRLVSCQHTTDPQTLPEPCFPPPAQEVGWLMVSTQELTNIRERDWLVNHALKTLFSIGETNEKH